MPSGDYITKIKVSKENFDTDFVTYKGIAWTSKSDFSEFESNSKFSLS